MAIEAIIALCSFGALVLMWVVFPTIIRKRQNTEE
jgi:hypothetical protein